MNQNPAHGAHLQASKSGRRISKKERLLIGGKGRRDYKDFSMGEYYHVFNRGNAKADIFLDSSDCELFINRLREALFPTHADGAHVQKRGARTQLPAGAFSLVAYCLMPNHYHLLVRQNTDLPISALVLKVCSGYGKVFNKRHDRVGSLFQDQFKVVHVDRNDYLLHLSSYIHQNPKVAGLVGALEDWRYCSYSEYASLKAAGGLCDTDIVLGQFKDAREYIRFVDESYAVIKEHKNLKHYLIDHE